MIFCYNLTRTSNEKALHLNLMPRNIKNVEFWRKGEEYYVLEEKEKNK